MKNKRIIIIRNKKSINGWDREEVIVEGIRGVGAKSDDIGLGQRRQNNHPVQT